VEVAVVGPCVPADGIDFEIEVEDLDEGVPVGGPRQKQIRRLQIAMHDAVGVRLRNGLARLQHVAHGFVHRMGRAASRRTRDPLRRGTP
jgi:hypothetical protein